MSIGWKLHEGTLGPNDVVAPDERLSWPKTVGLGAQHVVAMFGATFVFPLIMGLNAQLAIMMSGIATMCFLLIVKGKVPSYLGTSASFVGGVAAIRAQGGDSSTVTGAILVSGAVLLLVGRRDPLPRVRDHPHRAASGGHRRRRHADRLQPGPRRGDHLLAPGPVGCPARHGVRHRLRGGVARGFIRPYLDLPRAHLRHHPVLALRPHLRHDLLPRPRRRQDHPALPGQLGRRHQRAVDRLPAAHLRCSAARRSSAGTHPRSRWLRSCSSFPP